MVRVIENCMKLFCMCFSGYIFGHIFVQSDQTGKVPFWNRRFSLLACYFHVCTWGLPGFLLFVQVSIPLFHLYIFNSPKYIVTHISYTWF